MAKDDKSVTAIRQVKMAKEDELLQIPGVCGTDIDYKVTGGKTTDKLSIVVFVEEKKKADDVPAKERIPKTIDGIPTDVVEKRFVPHPLAVRLDDVRARADTGRYTTLEGGIGIGPCRSIFLEPPEVDTAGNYVFVGTLGCLVKDNSTDQIMALSNFHVMCVDNTWSVGDTMAQPSLVDGGSCPSDVVASLQRAQLNQSVDAAVATITDRTHVCEIVDIGDVKGTATAATNEAVRKRGRTTGLTHGTVKSTNLTVTIPYGDGLGSVTLKNQIRIDVDSSKSAQFGNSGDSGSVVVNKDNEVIGLYFAGTDDGSMGVANPIQSVLNAMNVTICTKPVIKKVEIKEKGELFEGKRFWKEHKEFFKEFHKDWKEYAYEKGFFEDFPRQPDLPFSGGELSVEERLSRLEAAASGPRESPQLSKPLKDFFDKPLKEKDKEFKEWKDKDKDIFEGGPVQPGNPAGGNPGHSSPPSDIASVEERLARLEASFGSRSHFIPPALRPDLRHGALRGEPDYRG